MFIEQGIKKENNFWKYLLGSFITFIASAIGQAPLMLAVMLKCLKDGKDFPTDENKLMSVLDSNFTLFLMLISFAFGLAGLFFAIKYLHNQSVISVTTTRKSIDWKRVWFSFSVWAIFSIASVGINYIMSPQDLVWNFKLMPFAILVIIATLLIPIQTSCEEYIFRGYLMQGFGNLFKNKWMPLIFTSVIFGSMHIANPEVDKMGYIILVYYIGTGFLLGIMTLMDDGMELSLGFHAANNLIGALLITADWTVFKTNSIFRDISNPEAGAEIFIPVFIIYPILLFILSKKYGWKNWKEKLFGAILLEKTSEIDTIGNGENH
jgi:uncharacterized protein